jgi:hypothetical protein
VAAETLRVVAWILTPEDGYEPPDNPIPQLLRKVACRVLESHPARGTVRCEQAAEAASTAAQFVLAVCRAPETSEPATAVEVNGPTGLDAVARAGLPEVLLAAARVCQHAPADAHQIPWNPWTRDGIETAALLGLSLAGVSSRRTLLPREKLARRFAFLSTRGQMAWLLHAADLLHRMGDPDAYGPPVGESPTREAVRADGPAATPQLAGEPAPPTRIEHAHEHGMYIQLFPVCLAPTDSDRSAQPDLALPREGDAVVIANGHVMFLTAADGTELFAPDSNQLWAAPTIGDGYGSARWDPDNVVQVDLAHVSFPDRDAEAMETAWTLLIDLAAQYEAGGRFR